MTKGKSTMLWLGNDQMKRNKYNECADNELSNNHLNCILLLLLKP